MSDTQDRLAAYIACERLILTGGQNVRAPDGRNVSMPDLEQIRAEIKSLRLAVSREQNRGRPRVAYSDFHSTQDHRRDRYRETEYYW